MPICQSFPLGIFHSHLSHLRPYIPEGTPRLLRPLPLLFPTLDRSNTHTYSRQQSSSHPTDSRTSLCSRNTSILSTILRLPSQRLSTASSFLYSESSPPEAFLSPRSSRLPRLDIAPLPRWGCLPCWGSLSPAVAALVSSAISPVLMRFLHSTLTCPLGCLGRLLSRLYLPSPWPQP